MGRRGESGSRTLPQASSGPGKSRVRPQQGQDDGDGMRERSVPHDVRFDEPRASIPICAASFAASPSPPCSRCSFCWRRVASCGWFRRRRLCPSTRARHAHRRRSTSMARRTRQRAPSTSRRRTRRATIRAVATRAPRAALRRSPMRQSSRSKRWLSLIFRDHPQHESQFARPREPVDGSRHPPPRQRCAEPPGDLARPTRRGLTLRVCTSIPFQAAQSFV